VFNVGPLELMVILVLALIVFGPEKLPELMAGAGRAIREFQRASSELTEVFEEARRDFSSAIDLNEAVAAEPGTAPYASDHAEPAEVPSTVSSVSDLPATTAPAELETAAAMIDPVAPFRGPPSAEPAPVAVEATAPPLELSRTAAGLVDVPPVQVTVDTPPVPEAIGATANRIGAAEAEPAAKPRRVRRPVSPS
jgi:TatA/E family protein of Tat protein translocase